MGWHGEGVCMHWKPSSWSSKLQTLHTINHIIILIYFSLSLSLYLYTTTHSSLLIYFIRTPLRDSLTLQKISWRIRNAPIKVRQKGYYVILHVHVISSWSFMLLFRMISCNFVMTSNYIFGSQLVIINYKCGRYE